MSPLKAAALRSQRNAIFRIIDQDQTHMYRIQIDMDADTWMFTNNRKKKLQKKRIHTRDNLPESSSASEVSLQHTRRVCADICSRRRACTTTCDTSRRRRRRNGMACDGRRVARNGA